MEGGKEYKVGWVWRYGRIREVLGMEVYIIKYIIQNSQRFKNKINVEAFAISLNMGGVLFVSFNLLKELMELVIWVFSPCL